MRFSIYSLALLTFTASGTLAPSSAAVEKPDVGLSFTVEEPVYLDRLIDQKDGSDKPRKAAENNFLIELHNRLAAKYGFLRFHIGSAPYRLNITLGRPDASHRGHSVDIQFTLSGKLDDKIEEISVSETCLFRGKGNSAVGLGGADGLVRELLLRFDVSSEENPCHRAILSLFRRIPVGQQGTTIQSDPYRIAWVLPFRDSDLCIGKDSRVQLNTEFDTGVDKPSRHFLTRTSTATDPQYRLRILCVPHPDNQRDLNLAIRYSKTVIVKHVFVITPTPMSTRCELPKPSEMAKSKGTRGEL
jgi:hypothetical protein